MTNVINAPKQDFSDIEFAAVPFNVLADHYGASIAATQLQIEHEAYTMGETRFLKAMQRDIERGEFADNAAAKPLLATLHPRFVARLDEWKEEVRTQGKGRKPTAWTLLQGVNSDTVGAIVLKCTISAVAKQVDVIIQQLASEIGRNIEDELRFGRIRDEEQKFFKRNVQPGLNKRKGQVFRKEFMKVVEASALEKGILDPTRAWKSWEKRDSMNVGVKMIEILIESTGLVQYERINAGNIASDAATIQLSDEYAGALSVRAGALAGITPVFQPCVVPPKPWTGPRGGGYWAAGRKPLNFVRTGSKKALERYNDVHMPEVYEAVNTAQNTAWRVNKRVLEVAEVMADWKNPMGDIPAPEAGEKPARPVEADTDEAINKAWRKEASAFYRLDKARKSRRASTVFTLDQARKFSAFKAIWFPMNMDYRGRVYAVPMFNPQGNDMTKGLLTMAEGKPVGEVGFYWLKIHGANCAGVDKVPFPERIKFIEDNHEHIMASAKDPLEYTWWAEQDSPFCFLAFCFEYAGVTNHGLSYNCSLPLAFDGSCSGIQHFSAMLRDEIGGQAVNLLPSANVQDIYTIVMNKVKEVIARDIISGTPTEQETRTDKKTGEITERTVYGSKVMAGWWMEYLNSIPVSKHRGVTKRSVMTLAYGSKEFGFRDQVLTDTIQPAIDAGKGNMFVNPNQAAGYMAKAIWECVSVTVVAAVEAMKWLQSAAKLLAAEVKDKKTGDVLRARCGVHWVTPDGFPVWQEYRIQEQERLDLMFLGEMRIRSTFNTGVVKGIDAKKQESGIAPNFVHSQDGSHLRKTVVHANRKYGIKAFALIHDSFGAIPADADNLFKAVRETIVETYENNNVLEDFREQFMDQLHESQLEKMPEIPSFGNLDLQEILKSDFAFA